MACWSLPWSVPTGQGKSWLIRQLVRRSPAASVAIRHRATTPTKRPRNWSGSDRRHPPISIRCTSSTSTAKRRRCESIGTSYLLVDAPGSTDDRRAIAAWPHRALSLASVLVLVVRRDQIRSEAVGMLTEASEGTIVVPVVNAVRHHDDTISMPMSIRSLHGCVTPHRPASSRRP